MVSLLYTNKYYEGFSVLARLPLSLLPEAGGPRIPFLQTHWLVWTLDTALSILPYSRYAMHPDCFIHSCRSSHIFQAYFIYFCKLHDCMHGISKPLSQCRYRIVNEKQLSLSQCGVFVCFFINLLTIYSIQYKYIKEIEITKQTKICGEGDSQKRKSTILGMSPLIKI